MPNKVRPLDLTGLSTRQIKALDKKIEAIFYKNCSGVQVNVLDIGKIFAAGRMVHAEGDAAIEAAVLAKVAELRLN